LCAASVGAFHIRQRLWWVANISSSRCEGDGLQPLWKGRDREREVMRPSGPIPACELADAGDPGLPPRQCEALGVEGRREKGGAVEQRGSSFWANAAWLPCRDGKWRPTEPGICPLSDGLPANLGCNGPSEIAYREKGKAPWRIGMLKGYGNAIVTQVAAEFVRVVS
jgi:DNA (cytosine-5)-methyltransferase 1